jgi:hypothetical protein
LGDKRISFWAFLLFTAANFYRYQRLPPSSFATSHIFSITVEATRHQVPIKIIDLRVSPPSQRKDNKKLTHIANLIMFKAKVDNLPPDPKYPADLKELGYVRSIRCLHAKY